MQRLLGLALVSEPERQAYVLGTLAEAAVAAPAKAVIADAGGCSTITRCPPPAEHAGSAAAPRYMTLLGSLG